MFKLYSVVQISKDSKCLVYSTILLTCACVSCLCAFYVCGYFDFVTLKSYDHVTCLWNDCRLENKPSSNS